MLPKKNIDFLQLPLRYLGKQSKIFEKTARNCIFGQLYQQPPDRFSSFSAVTFYSSKQSERRKK